MFILRGLGLELRVDIRLLRLGMDMDTDTGDCMGMEDRREQLGLGGTERVR